MKLTIKNGLLLAGAGLFFTLTGLAAAQDNRTPPTTDMNFVSVAAVGNMEQIDAANLTPQRAYFYRVRDFAKRMADDHRRLNAQLTAIGEKDGFTLPNVPDAHADVALNRLSALSGPKFDREYIAWVIAQHQRAVTAYQNESTHGMNIDLRKFAADNLPEVQEHLRLAKDIQLAEQNAEADGFMTRK